jgi:hypothetical protein
MHFQTTIVQGGSLTITLRNITTTSFKGELYMETKCHYSNCTNFQWYD